MKIQAYVKDAVYTINCGSGAQKIRWLAEAAAIKHDSNGMFTIGQPKYVKLEDGTILNMNDRINQRLFDNLRVWIIFEEIKIEEKKKDTKNNKK